MHKVLAFLSGKKTYLVSVAMAAYNLAVADGMVSAHRQAQVNFVLVALGVAALRAGIAKATPVVDAPVEATAVASPVTPAV